VYSVKPPVDPSADPEAHQKEQDVKRAYCRYEATQTFLEADDHLVQEGLQRLLDAEIAKAASFAVNDASRVLLARLDVDPHKCLAFPGPSLAARRQRHLACFQAWSMPPAAPPGQSQCISSSCGSHARNCSSSHQSTQTNHAACSAGTGVVLFPAVSKTHSCAWAAETAGSVSGADGRCVVGGGDYAWKG